MKTGVLLATEAEQPAFSQSGLAIMIQIGKSPSPSVNQTRKTIDRPKLYVLEDPVGRYSQHRS